MTMWCSTMVSHSWSHHFLCSKGSWQPQGPEPVCSGDHSAFSHSWSNEQHNSVFAQELGIESRGMRCRFLVYCCICFKKKIILHSLDYCFQLNYLANKKLVWTATPHASISLKLQKTRICAAFWPGEQSLWMEDAFTWTPSEKKNHKNSLSVFVNRSLLL